MAKGVLEMQITDMAGQPIGGRVDIDMSPLRGTMGAGGAHMEVGSKLGTATELDITGIECRGGPGSMYRLLATAEHYRPYAFFQLIQEGSGNTAADDIEFWVKPGDVTGIVPPDFGALPDVVRAMLTGAQMTSVTPADKELAGASGETLYKQLGPLRQAGFLNIVKKASHFGAASCLPMFGALLISRQDRIFAMVDAALPAHLRTSVRFTSAPPTLHQPLAGFEMTGESFKSRDAHANLQVTFMRETTTGALAADIDIDEASGIQHGLEVIRNAVFQNKTNPYLIREFLLSADMVEHTLDPGYRFKFS